MLSYGWERSFCSCEKPQAEVSKTFATVNTGQLWLGGTLQHFRAVQKAVTQLPSNSKQQHEWFLLCSGGCGHLMGVVTKLFWCTPCKLSGSTLAKGTSRRVPCGCHAMHAQVLGGSQRTEQRCSALSPSSISLLPPAETNSLWSAHPVSAVLQIL